MLCCFASEFIVNLILFGIDELVKCIKSNELYRT